MKVTVGVIGKNEQHPNDKVDAHTMEAAETIGRLVAERGSYTAMRRRFGNRLCSALSVSRTAVG